MSAKEDGFLEVSFDPTVFHSSGEDDPEGLGGDGLELGDFGFSAE